MQPNSTTTKKQSENLSLLSDALLGERATEARKWDHMKSRILCLCSVYSIGPTYPASGIPSHHPPSANQAMYGS